MKKLKNSAFVSYGLLFIVGFLIWAILNLVLWFVLEKFGIGDNFWTIFEAMSTTAAILIAGVVAIREIRESNKSRHLSVMENLFEELNSREQIEARKWIYLHLPPTIDEINQLDEDDRYKIKLVLNSIDKVAFLTQSDWIPVEVIMDWINPMIVKTWEKLGPIVLEERVKRNEPDYYKDAGNFAQICINWRERKYPGKDHTWVQEGDLV